MKNMLFFRQLKLLKSLLQKLFLLTTVICLCQAGVIKKRDTQPYSASGNLTEVQPTILTAIASGNGINASEIATTILQSVSETGFSTETSKELTNNEILLNEAKKLLEEADKIINTNNETKLKAETETNIKEKDSEQSKENEEPMKETNIKDIKEIIKHLEDKEKNLSATSKSSAEFNSNAIKQDKDNERTNDIDKNKQEFSSEHYEENSQNEKNLFKKSESDSRLYSFENSVKSSEVKPTVSNKMPTKLHIESNNDAILRTEVHSKNSLHEENVIDQSKETDALKVEMKKKTEEEITHQEANIVEKNKERDPIKLENLGYTGILQKAESELPKKIENSEEKMAIQKENVIEMQKEKESVRLEKSEHQQPTENPETNFNQKIHSNRIQTNFTAISEKFEVPATATIVKSNNILSENKIKNNIYDTMEGEVNSLDTPTTTLTPEHYVGLAIFEGTKNQYARSMAMEETSTEKSLTTVKSVVLSIQEGIEETNEAAKNVVVEKENPQNTLTLKEKKPKFINDNSTNAQQLNLPNNAEVWSLAAMKTLPKSNNSLETTQAHTETFKEHKEEDEKKRTTPHNVTSSTIISNISEKTLLDWSQIMMDKELSNTTRNEEYKQDNDLELSNSTTSQTNFEGGLEQKISTIPATTTLATILSFTNDDNNNVADKKVEENMNNHIDLMRETQETTTAATTTSTTNTNLPLNATLNTEPNLNEEINLTLKHNKVDELIVNTTIPTTNVAGKLILDVEEASASTSTSTATTTSTEATAVDMTTVVVEQNSSETTTVSTLETSKQNSISSTDDVLRPQQQVENNFDKNINEIVNESFTNSSHTVENTLNKNHTDIENNEFNLKSIILTSTTIPTTTTTTTVVPITTIRPSILVITSSTTSTSTPATIKQEIDQNGNEIQTNFNEIKQIGQQQQSILIEATTTTATTENSLHYVYNSTKVIETHLEAKQYGEEETTTLETITENTTTVTTDLAEKKESLEENIKAKNNTSFSSDKEEENEIVTDTIGSKLDNIETLKSTPKSDDKTTSGSPVVSSTVEYNEEDRKKELEIETTTAVVAAGTTKTPVVFIETQGVTTEPHESSTENTSTTIITATKESVIESTVGTIQQQESEIKTKEEEDDDDEKTVTEENDSKNELSTTIKPDISKSTITTTTTNTETIIEETTKKTTEKTTMATAKDDETFISLLDDITTTNSPTPTIETTTTTPILSTTMNSTTTPQTLLSTSTTTITTTTTSEPSPITTKIEEIYNVIHSTTTEFIQTTTPHLNAETKESPSSSSPTTTTATVASFYPTTSSSSDMIPLATTTTTTTPSTTQIVATADLGKSLPTLTSIMGGSSGNMYPKNTEASNETDVNVIIAITVSVIGVIALILLVGFLYIMRKRQKQTSYSQRCRPVSLDEYTIDNVSVGGSMRKSSALRSSKRTYGNLAFDDPSLRHNPMGVHELAKFVQEKLRIFEEFRDVPQITSRLDEVPPGCEDKNRYANVLPLPETRVILQRLNHDDKTEYINANYVTGPKDPPNYYIACQAPLESTVEDFWRMIWEQQSRVIIQATDLIENGIEKCAEYLPPSVTLDNHSTFGNFQITLQNREVKDKYAISTILLKNVSENTSRELTHYWYKWPEVGVPAEEAPIIAMLLEARSSLLSYANELANEDKEKASTVTLRSVEEGTVSSINGSTTSPAKQSNGSSSCANGSSSGEINGNISMVQIKKTARNQGPLTVHCSPGTGRTGTIIACDIAIRSLETPKRTVDIPHIVYYVRRGRASAVLTKEQYEFIYKVANMYAAKITNPTNYN